MGAAVRSGGIRARNSQVDAAPEGGRTIRDGRSREKVWREGGWEGINRFTNSTPTYFEIKIEPTVKRCIRLALGQLLEYAHYPHDGRAARFVVVGDAPVSQDDKAYLAHLRETYGLPAYYSRFLWEQDHFWSCDLKMAPPESRHSPLDYRWQGLFLSPEGRGNDVASTFRITTAREPSTKRVSKGTAGVRLR